MKKFWQNHKSKIIFLVLVGLAFWGYGQVFRGSDDILDTEPDIIGQNVLELVDQLDAINLDSNIFNDPAFNSLKDITVEVRPELAGRDNPFAPIGFGNSAESTVVGQ